MAEAKQIILKHNLDEGLPGPEHFTVAHASVPSTPSGGIKVQALVFSADPYMVNRSSSQRAFKVLSLCEIWRRTHFNAILSVCTHRESHTITLQRKMMRKDHMKPDHVMEGFIAGIVLDSQSSDWEEGDLFGAKLPFITVQTLSEGDLKTHTIWKLTDYITEDQISLGVGILGMPGATAHAGIKHVLRPKEGETLFVNAACGAVGSMAGQIAKHVYKCTVIGSCGGPKKCDIIRKQFGFDHAVDYKQCRNKDDLIEAVRKYAPEGLDMAFENVGGMHFDAAYALLKPHGRIAVCGSISTFNDAAPSTNEIDLVRVLSEGLRIEGFTVWPWLKCGEYLKDMSTWWKEGKVKVEETDHKGIEEWPNAFRSLFTGGNVGKVVVRVA
eukprot:19332-Heterococcus_DN1.PRE.12